MTQNESSLGADKSARALNDRHFTDFVDMYAWHLPSKGFQLSSLEHEQCRCFIMCKMRKVTAAEVPGVPDAERENLPYRKCCTTSSC